MYGMGKRAWKNSGQGSGNYRPTPRQLSQGYTDWIDQPGGGFHPAPGAFTSELSRGSRPRVPGVDGPRVHPGPNGEMPPGEYDQYRPEGMSDQEWADAMRRWGRWGDKDRRLSLSFEDWLARYLTRGNRSGSGRVGLQQGGSWSQAMVNSSY